MAESYEPDRALWAQFDAMGEEDVRQALIHLTLAETADWQASLWLGHREGPMVRDRLGRNACLRDTLTTADARVRALILDAAYRAGDRLRKAEDRVHQNFDRLATSPNAHPAFVSGWTGMELMQRIRMARRAALDAYAVTHKDESEAPARALKTIYGELTGEHVRPWRD